MGKIELERGTTYGITGTYKENGTAADITRAVIRFTVKEEEWDADADDSDAQIAKNGVIVSAPAGTYSITLSDVDTYQNPGDYYYSIKIELANGNIYLLDKGKFKVRPNTTNRAT